MVGAIMSQTALGNRVMIGQKTTQSNRGSCLFFIDRSELPDVRYTPTPLAIVVGVSLEGFCDPQGYFNFKTWQLHFTGWYNEIQINAIPYTGNMEFCIRSTAAVVVVCAWFIEIASIEQYHEPTMRLLPTKRYDVGFHWIPTQKCNLACTYCTEQKSQTELPIDVTKLRRTLQETDRVIKFTFTGGGEPLLVSNIVEACKVISQNHYLAFTTNLLSDAVCGLVRRIDPARVDYLMVSVHPAELEKRNLYKKLISHYHQCMAAGFSISAQAVAYPPLLPRLEEYRSQFANESILLTFAPFMGIYKRLGYPDAYTDEELAAIGVTRDFLAIYSSKNTLCNAGFNTGVIFESGDIHVCYALKESIGNIYNGIELRNRMISCPNKHCYCPLSAHDPMLFKLALQYCKSEQPPPLITKSIPKTIPL
jgi:MoaA/NifB/PqqE/SkfB family radical SAM enzyme